MLLRLLYVSLVVLCFGCGSDQHADLEESAARDYYRRHAQDAETGEYLKDSLTYPGNQPRDPVTGELEPEPVRNWNFVDQMNRPFGRDSLLGKVYVADFFFTSCPTICPQVKGQMLRLEEEFADREDFALVSFTVDPKRDTPEKMLDYADKLGIVDHDRWRFIHGDKFEIYDLDADYLSIAEENSSAPGGFDHSGWIVLVDREGFVRSYANGRNPDEVSLLMDDVRLLLEKNAR